MLWAVPILFGAYLAFQTTSSNLSLGQRSSLEILSFELNLPPPELALRVMLTFSLITESFLSPAFSQSYVILSALLSEGSLQEILRQTHSGCPRTVLGAAPWSFYSALSFLLPNLLAANSESPSASGREVLQVLANYL